uniref:Uncharacterized LOC105921800 n=1 Tax=Fundulus heteroclitus TaxID=8078 RepID=A0A3Q2TSC8_FUNHE
MLVTSCAASAPQGSGEVFLLQLLPAGAPAADPCSQLASNSRSVPWGPVLPAEMDLWFLRLGLVLWSLTARLAVLPLEISVRHFELEPCKGNDRVCVTNPRDCEHLPHSSSQKKLNMSCYYQESSDGVRSVSCSWSQDSESEASLVFTSQSKIYSCWGIFNPAAILSVRARIRSFLPGADVWSQPHWMVLFDAVKPFPPVLRLTDSSADSLVVSWKSSVDSSCRLRYRLNDTRTWIEVSHLIPAHKGQNLNYTITNLLPFTAYKAAVACRTGSNIWSDWSSDTTVQTLDRVPSSPAETCFRVEKTDNDGSLLLHLWMASDPGESAGRVLGHQVWVHPQEHVQNITETTAILVVKEGNYTVTVRAFNTAGFGPAARLQIDTRTLITLPSVRNLWISSDYSENDRLHVRWTAPSSVLPGSHVAVRWRSERNPSTSRWLRVHGFTSATLTGVDPDESYLVSVFPVSSQQCGPPQTLAASLQHGALMEPTGLKVVSVTKTTVTVTWAWHRTSGSRVERYRVMLRSDADKQTLSLWPDQQQHTFSNLTPSTDYALLLLADHVPTTIVPVATYFDEVPAVATATPLLVLLVMMTIVSVLSRTLYKSYFFPPIANPCRSTAGQWLQNPNMKKRAERSFLDIAEFQVNDVLGGKHLLLVGPNHQLSSEDPLDHGSPQSICDLFVHLAAGKADPPGDPDLGAATGQQLISLQSVLTSEDIGGTDVPLLLRQEETSCSPQTEEDTRPTSDPRSAATFQLSELMADFLREAEAATGPYLTYEVEYLTNGCFRAEPTAEDETNISPVSTSA